MTTPSPLRHDERTPAVETVWVTDAELIRRSGVPEKIMRQRLLALDADKFSGFPKKNKIWGDRRHWPSVKKYWEEQAQAPTNFREQVKMELAQRQGGRP